MLILGPGNYPLFLPGAQALQALAAGNAVCVKPAPGASAPMLALADLLTARRPAGGRAADLLDEAAGPEASRAGFDYIVLTGSAETGAAVLRDAAETLTPDGDGALRRATPYSCCPAPTWRWSRPAWPMGCG